MSSTQKPITTVPSLDQTSMNRSFVCHPRFVNDIYKSGFEVNIKTVFYGAASNCINKLFWYPFPVNLKYTSYSSNLTLPIDTIEKSNDGEGCQAVSNYARWGYDISNGVIGIESKYGDYRDYNPYTRIVMTLPYYGDVELNPRDVIGKYLRVIMTVDFNTGEATYGVYVQSEVSNGYTGNSLGFSQISTYDKIERCIGSYTFQLGTSMPLSIFDDTQVVRSALGIASNILSTAVNAVTCEGTARKTASPDLPLEDPRPNTSSKPQLVNGNALPPGRSLQVGTAATSIIRSSPDNRSGPDLNALLSLIHGQDDAPPVTGTLSVTGTLDLQRLFKGAGYALGAMKPPKLNFAAGGGYSNFSQPNSIIITYYRAKATDEPDQEYGENFGYQYSKQVTQLSSMQGFTVIAAYTPQGKFAKATQTEKGMIDQVLLQGVKLPYTLSSTKVYFSDGTVATIKFAEGQTWREWISCGGNNYSAGYIPNMYTISAFKGNKVAVRNSAGNYYNDLVTYSSLADVYLDSAITTAGYKAGAWT